MKTKDLFFAFLGIVISIFLIYLTFSKINTSLFIAHLSKINILFTPLFFLSTFSEILFRTIKWYLILRVFAYVEIKKLFKFEVIALGINNILPLRMGELSKMMLISKYYQISKTTALSTVFIERLIDSLILFLILISYSIFGGINLQFIDKKNAFYITTSIIVFIYLFFVYSEKITQNSLKKFEKRYPHIHSLFIKIRNGGVCFKNPLLTLLIIITGIIQWNFDVLNNYIIAKALSIQAIDFSKAAITVVVGSLSASIPSMPGYFGNYEYAISRLCILWGIDKELSVLFPTLIHIITYIILTFTAMIFIYTEEINLKNLINSKGK